MNLVEMQRQGEAFYALKVPSKNTEKLFDEITSLLEVDKDKFQYAPVGRFVFKFFNASLQPQARIIAISWVGRA
jgi:hypothetical protein